MSEKLLTEEYKAELDLRFAAVRADIQRSGRGDKVTLMAATKTLSCDVINYAAEHLGLQYIGENRVQELLSKYDGLRRDLLHIHFIGRLQKNKVKYIIDKVEMIESLDSMELALEINKQALKFSRVMDVLVEVNIGSESSKGGIAPHMAKEFINRVEKLENIRVRGLMVIPPISDSEEYKKFFLKTYGIFIDIFGDRIHNNSDKEGYILSMGMSDSYNEAIMCGATLIRVGSALFGKRDYNKA